MLRLPLLCAVAVILAPAPAAADTASDWLLRVSDASRQANYQGVVVYRDGQRMDVMKLVHRHHEGRVQERLTSLTGRPRDILREGDSVAVTGDEPVRSSGPTTLFPMLSREVLGEAAPHYEYRDLGQARVAGRACRGVVMAPRDEFRYGYEICGDVEHGVPLRVTVLDRGGRTVEQLLFTEIAFPASIPDAAFAPSPGATPAPGPAAPLVPNGLTPATAPAPTPTAAAEAAVPGWRLVTLPPGFRVVRRELLPSPDGQGVIEHLLLSDGLSAVSVFGVRPRMPDRVFRGLSHLGAMNAYGRRVGAFHITVIGEVPPSTVRMIGDGLAAPPEGAPAEPDKPPASLTD